METTIIGIGVGIADLIVIFLMGFFICSHTYLWEINPQNDEEKEKLDTLTTINAKRIRNCFIAGVLFSGSVHFGLEIPLIVIIIVAIIDLICGIAYRTNLQKKQR